MSPSTMPLIIMTLHNFTYHYIAVDNGISIMTMVRMTLGAKTLNKMLINLMPLMGIHHPLDGITNLKYKLLYFLIPNQKLQRERH
jgi:hypothetical protein